MRVATVALVLLLCGCGTTSIEPSYYLMRPQQDLPSGALTASRAFALGEVSIATYLDQPGLVIETADGTLRPARQHLWAEPAHDSIRNLLAVEISLAKGEDLLPDKLNKGAIAVDIRIDELHGTEDGSAKLVAYWWLRHDTDVLNVYRFSHTMELSNDGYAALVDAEEALLTDLARKIAATLVAVPIPGDKKSPGS